MIEATFEKERETKGTWQFKEETAPGVRGTFGSLYVLKTKLAELGDPDRLKVTVEAAE